MKSGTLSGFVEGRMLVMEQPAESFGLQNANRFHCELSRNQRPLGPQLTPNQVLINSDQRILKPAGEEGALESPPVLTLKTWTSGSIS